MKETKGIQGEVMELISRFAKLLDLKKTQLRIYELLVRKNRPMFVSEISKSLNASRRIVQDYVKDLTEKGFLSREIASRGYLAYRYVSRSPINVWGRIRKEISRMVRKGDKTIKT